MINILAALINRDDINFTGPIDTTTANASVTGVLNTVYAWAAIIAVIVLIIAGFLYVTSSGDPAKTKRAKDAIIGAVVGVVVVAMAFAITNFVVRRL